MHCNLPGFSIHGIFQARVLEWAAISFSRGLFPTQGVNLGLPHCRQALYHLSHQESYTNSIWDFYSLPEGSFLNFMQIRWYGFFQGLGMGDNPSLSRISLRFLPNSTICPCYPYLHLCSSLFFLFSH